MNMIEMVAEDNGKRSAPYVGSFYGVVGDDMPPSPFREILSTRDYAEIPESYLAKEFDKTSGSDTTLNQWIKQNTHNLEDIACPIMRSLAERVRLFDGFKPYKLYMKILKD